MGNLLSFALEQKPEKNFLIELKSSKKLNNSRNYS
jgi:hypothetical protein